MNTYGLLRSGAVSAFSNGLLRQSLQKHCSHSQVLKTSRPKAFVTRELPMETVDTLHSLLDLQVWHEQDYPRQKEIIENVKGCETLISLLTDPIDASVINHENFKDVRLITQYAVGYNNIDIVECTKQGILVTNTPGVLTDTMVETTFSLMLAAARRIVEGDKIVRTGQWSVAWHPNFLLGNDIHGSQVGIVGLGRIGQKVAAIAELFGAKVVYCARMRNVEFESKHPNVQFMDVDELCKTSDFVSLHCNLTPLTHHIINEERLKLMKPTAVLVNTGRGQLIDENALVQALKERRIFAAGLDVYQAEPISGSHEICQLDNVVIAPHIGSASVATRRNMGKLVCQNQYAYWNKGNLPSLLNPEAMSHPRHHQTEA